MMKVLIICACITLLVGLSSPACATANPTFPKAVLDLIAEQYPEHTITSKSGFGNEQQGQYALVLNKEKQHVLVIAEKEKAEPAYRLTIENPTAFMPGDTHPSAMIDTGGGDSLFYSFTGEDYHWSFHSVKQDGQWGDVDLQLHTLYPYPNDEEQIGQYMHLVDDQLFSTTTYEDSEGNVKETYVYPPIPAPQLKGKLAVHQVDWQLFPIPPEALLSQETGTSHPDTLEALTPEGWTLISANMNVGGIYVLGIDAQGDTRLLLKRWQAEPLYPTRGGYVDTISAPLPEGIRLQAKILGSAASLFQDEDNRGFTFGQNVDGDWMLGFVMAQDWYSVYPFFLYLPSSTDETFYYGNFPYGDIRSIDLTGIPNTFEEAKSILDQSGWAKVNNPNPQDRLHLRTRPERGADSLGKFYNGTPVKVLERQGDWVRVQIAHLDGWMMAEYLAFGRDANHVQRAFPGMVGLESLEDCEMPLYARADENSPVITSRSTSHSLEYWIVGVVDEEWYFVYFYRDGIGGYIQQKWFWEGNG